MDTSLALNLGLLYGAILSVVMTVLVIGILRFNNEILLDDYPADIRAKWGPMSDRARRQRRWVALPMFGLILALLVLQVVQLVQRSGAFSFGSVALSLWVSMMLFNLYDLLVIDWFMLMVLKPRFAYLPGTEGMQGYSDYLFPAVGFVKGTVGITLAAPVLAGIAYAIYALLR
jgi:hypothetical protein